MAEFEIKVTELDAGGKNYLFPIRPSWLAEQLAALGDAGEGLAAPEKEGSFRFFADKSGEDVFIRGHVTSGLTAECSRCLGRAPIDVDSEIALLFCARGKGIRPQPGEEDLTPDEIEHEFYTGDTVVFDDAVREHILLEVPMQPLCREDCPGIPVPESVRGPADLAEPEAVEPPLGPLAKALAAAGLASASGKPANGPTSGPTAEPAKVLGNGNKTKRAR